MLNSSVNLVQVLVNNGSHCLEKGKKTHVLKSLRARCSFFPPLSLLRSPFWLLVPTVVVSSSEPSKPPLLSQAAAPAPPCSCFQPLHRGRSLNLTSPCPHCSLMTPHYSVSTLDSLPLPLLQETLLPALPQFGQSFNKQINNNLFFPAYKIIPAHYRNIRNKEKN